jgi:hypothetical protein
MRDKLLTALAAATLATVMFFAAAAGLERHAAFDCAEGTVIVQPGDRAILMLRKHCTGNVQAALYAANWPTVIIPGMELTLPTNPNT